MPNYQSRDILLHDFDPGDFDGMAYPPLPENLELVALDLMTACFIPKDLPDRTPILAGIVGRTITGWTAWRVGSVHPGEPDWQVDNCLSSIGGALWHMAQNANHLSEQWGDELDPIGKMWDRKQAANAEMPGMQAQEATSPAPPSDDPLWEAIQEVVHLRLNWYANGGAAHGNDTEYLEKLFTPTRRLAKLLDQRRHQAAPATNELRDALSHDTLDALAELDRAARVFLYAADSSPYQAKLRLEKALDRANKLIALT